MERTARTVRYRHQLGILAKLRDSAGQEIEAGVCGQLWAWVEKLIKRA